MPGKIMVSCLIRAEVRRNINIIHFNVLNYAVPDIILTGIIERGKYDPDVESLFPLYVILIFHFLPIPKLLLFAGLTGEK